MTFIIVCGVCAPAAPRHLDVQRIREDLLKLEDVQSVDELNVWALTSDKTAALVHLQLCESPQHTRLIANQLFTIRQLDYRPGKLVPDRRQLLSGLQTETDLIRTWWQDHCDHLTVRIPSRTYSLSIGTYIWLFTSMQSLQCYPLGTF